MSIIAGLLNKSKILRIKDLVLDISAIFIFLIGLVFLLINAQFSQYHVYEIYIINDVYLILWILLYQISFLFRFPKLLKSLKNRELGPEVQKRVGYILIAHTFSFVVGLLSLFAANLSH